MHTPVYKFISQEFTGVKSTLAVLYWLYIMQKFNYWTQALTYLSMVAMETYMHSQCNSYIMIKSVEHFINKTSCMSEPTYETLNLPKFPLLFIMHGYYHHY